MGDKQSFYEIQLSTRHLVLAFLGATAAGVAFFWLGVIVGGGQTGPGLPDQWQAAAPAEEVVEEPYQFYNAVNEILEGATDPPSQPEAGQQRPVSAPRFESADQGDGQRAEVAAESPTGLPQPDASLSSGWIVQVRSTPVRLDADSLQSALATAGLPAFVVSTEVSGVTYYRVRVGRYHSKGEADIIEAELLTRSDVDTTWVTEG